MRIFLKSIAYLFLWVGLVILVLGIFASFGWGLIQLTYNDVTGMLKFVGVSILCLIASVVYYSIFRQLKFKKLNKYSDGAYIEPVEEVQEVNTKIEDVPLMPEEDEVVAKEPVKPEDVFKGGLFVEDDDLGLTRSSKNRRNNL